jgi:hypothetical protein
VEGVSQRSTGPAPPTHRPQVSTEPKQKQLIMERVAIASDCTINTRTTMRTSSQDETKIQTLRSRLIRGTSSGIRPKRFTNFSYLGCVRCDGTPTTGSPSSYHPHRMAALSAASGLEECAHCGFDVCRACRHPSQRSVYAILFYALQKNPCLCNECHHMMRCVVD